MDNQNTLHVQTHAPMQAIAISDVKNQILAIEEVIKTVMKDGLHYGKIAGCGEKPTLLKPGAEMLAKLFNIRPEFRRDRRDLGSGHLEILSSCVMYSRASGQPVGEGAGTCSTMESKYRWRKAGRSCPACGVEGSISRSKFLPKDAPDGTPGWYCRDCKAQFDYKAPEICNQITGRVENPDIADQYNTVQKMADKRAYVAAVITTVGASDFVTQDIEDFYESAQSGPAIHDGAPIVLREKIIPPTPPTAQPETKLSGIEAGEKIKAALEAREHADSWNIFKEKIIKEFPKNGKLTDNLAGNYGKIIERINAGEFDLPF